MSLFFLLKRGEIVENIVMGILAHVDAGKTTLSEGMLYLSGTVRKLGRVDHKDAFLDTYSLERDRGITIFSKQAVFSLGNRRINLLDTPGHVDFSAEMERTLQVLDYAVLVISGADGVQGHTETLLKLLKLYEIPTFIFINKMDQPGTDRESLLTELKERLDEGCIVFGKGKNVESLEEIAMTDEVVLDYFMEHETVRNEDICRLIRERKIFPCYFGSALKLDGVQELLAGFEEYMKPFDGKKGFGARVFKISRDDKGERLTFLKVTGGKLVVKMPINKEEKINQIRIYSGAKYEAVNEVEAGRACGDGGVFYPRRNADPPEGKAAGELQKLRAVPAARADHLPAGRCPAIRTQPDLPRVHVAGGQRHTHGKARRDLRGVLLLPAEVHHGAFSGRRDHGYLEGRHVLHADVYQGRGRRPPDGRAVQPAEHAAAHRAAAHVRFPLRRRGRADARRSRLPEREPEQRRGYTQHA